MGNGSFQLLNDLLTLNIRKINKVKALSFSNNYNHQLTFP